MVSICHQVVLINQNETSSKRSKKYLLRAYKVQRHTPGTRGQESALGCLRASSKLGTTRQRPDP